MHEIMNCTAFKGLTVYTVDLYFVVNLFLFLFLHLCATE